MTGKPSAWIASRLPDVDLGSSFGAWIVALLILNGLSLVIDGVDVARYALGERDAAHRLTPNGGAPAATST